MRKTAIKRHGWIGQGKPRKPLPKVNKERALKKAKRYSTLLGRYRNSRTYHLVEKRAAGQCERVTDGVRCEYLGPLIHNHLSYQRFGGKELPADVEAVCPHHNGLYEAARPWRRRGKVARG